MAKQYDITVYAQPSLYDAKERTITIYFSEPENGANEDTGILLLNAGYGGEANSNVFKKMRDTFADKYNYITVQCNYFGWEYMQTPNVKDISISYNELRSVLSDDQVELVLDDYDKNKYLLEGKSIEHNVELGESADSFNDMGPLQAIDSLTAIKVVADILEQNNIIINKKRIHAYGFSHGAYINYLCNAFMPGVFSGIIDNSAYVVPKYLNYKREVKCYIDKLFFYKSFFRYLLFDIVFDKELYDLTEVYNEICNKAKVISFHGMKDDMTSCEEKKHFLELTKKYEMIVIDEDKVDGDIFKSCTHGLDADFLKMFDYVMENYDLDNDVEGLSFTGQTIKTKEYIYRIDLVEGMPKLTCDKK